MREAVCRGSRRKIGSSLLNDLMANAGLLGSQLQKHHTSEQIIRKLRQVERLTTEGATVKEAVRQIEVTKQT